jgi:hypothetical protein
MLSKRVIASRAGTPASYTNNGARLENRTQKRGATESVALQLFAVVMLAKAGLPENRM